MGPGWLPLARLLSLPQNVFDLQQRRRDLMEPSDVILVVLDRIERNGIGQIGEVRVQSALRGDRHLVILEVPVVRVFLKSAHEQIVRRLILFVESFRRDRFDARQE